MTDDTPKDSLEAQKVEWYAASLTAWFGTRLELDKSLLTLSAGGIGLLISLVSAFGIQSIESLLLFILALTAFICCMAAVLWILKRNSTHIEEALHQDKGPEALLGILDSVAIISFFAGVSLSAIIGIAVAVTSFETKRTQTPMPTKTTVPGNANDGVNGLQNMRPDQNDLGKSFNGVANMAPGAQPSTAQRPVSPATQPTQPQTATAPTSAPASDARPK